MTTTAEFLDRYTPEAIQIIRQSLACQPEDSPRWRVIRESAQNHLELVRESCISRMGFLETHLDTLAEKWYAEQQAALKCHDPARAVLAAKLGEKHKDKMIIWFNLDTLYNRLIS